MTAEDAPPYKNVWIEIVMWLAVSVVFPVIGLLCLLMFVLWPIVRVRDLMRQFKQRKRWRAACKQREAALMGLAATLRKSPRSWVDPAAAERARLDDEYRSFYPPFHAPRVVPFRSVAR